MDLRLLRPPGAIAKLRGRVFIMSEDGEGRLINGARRTVFNFGAVATRVRGECFVDCSRRGISEFTRSPTVLLLKNCP